MLEHDRAEVIETEATQGSVLTGRRIRDSIADLPDGVVTGAIARTGELMKSRDGTVIGASDHLALFVDAEVLDKVIELI